MKVKALLIISLLLLCSTAIQAQKSNKDVYVAPTAQQEPSGVQRRAADLEIEKLELEVAKLKEKHADWPTWLTALLGILTGVIGTAVSFWAVRQNRLAAQQAREGATDQATHEKRLESYPKLVNVSAPLAIYFPVYDDSGAAVSRKQCAVMGREMSKWYFEEGGLLMSDKAKNAYFRLARALTRASLANDQLKVPKFPADAENISKEQIDTYCRQLGAMLDLVNVDNWTFGGSASKTEGDERRPYLQFKDYVFLQRLSSGLRTELSEDLHSRRLPS